jgi:predicted nucleotidyltransferase
MDRIEGYRDRLAVFCRKWGVGELSIFGSFLGDDARPDADVDILISFDKGAHCDLFDIMAMNEELREIFGREVDLVEREGVRNPYRRAGILNNRRVIYAA